LVAQVKACETKALQNSRAELVLPPRDRAYTAAHDPDAPPPQKSVLRTPVCARASAVRAILWWSLNRLFKWYDSSGYEEILFGTTRWGFVYVAFLGDKIPDPSVYRPYARTKPPWDDPAWASDVPLAVALSSTSLRMDANTVLASSGLNGLEGLEGVRIMALTANTS
jgi:hypothetical protein